MWAMLRRRRPAINPAHSAPLTFNPVVSVRDRAGKVFVYFDTNIPVWQWDPDEAIAHGHDVLTCVALAPLENEYVRLFDAAAENSEVGDETRRMLMTAVAHLNPLGDARGIALIDDTDVGEHIAGGEQ
jgi:hypothetical protein